MTKCVEYRVKTTSRYIITRFVSEGGCDEASSVVGRGEYASPHIAFEIAYALAEQERRAMGLPPGSDRVIFPEHPLGPEHEAACVNMFAPH